MIVLIHTSKTMRERAAASKSMTTPALLDRAQELVAYLRTLSVSQVSTVMGLSAPLAAKTHEQFCAWSPDPRRQAPAAESFVGDIYSGLQVGSFTAADRTYAGKRLRILSGLYGILRPFDGISPYRLEMGYRLPDARYANLYRYWGTSVAEQLPAAGRVINLSANEYGKVVLNAIDPKRVVAPKFLTVDPKDGEPKFVAVHAKVARGAFAHWLITARIPDDTDALVTFDAIGYRYHAALSTPNQPCFVCTEFGGKGLSVRLQ